MLARVVEEPADLDRYRAAVPGADVTIVRLTSPESTRLARLLERMAPGPSRDWHVERTVGNDGVPRDVAMAILQRVGWI